MNRRNCPRCGLDYRGFPTRSRHADAEICPACGRDESIRSMLGMPDPIDSWARWSREK